MRRQIEGHLLPFVFMGAKLPKERERERTENRKHAVRDILLESGIFQLPRWEKTIAAMMGGKEEMWGEALECGSRNKGGSVLTETNIGGTRFVSRISENGRSPCQE